MRIVRLLIAFLGFCSISGETVRDLSNHQSEFGQGSLATSDRKKALTQVIVRKGTRVSVRQGRFLGQIIRANGRRVIVRRSKRFHRQRVVRRGRGKLVHHSVKRTKDSVKSMTVRKSSGVGWSRKVIVKTWRKIKKKKKRWWNKRGNFNPFKWKVRAMKVKVREFRGGYVRFRGKWFISKNGRVSKPNKKARRRLKRTLSVRFRKTLRKIRRQRTQKFLKKLTKLSRRKLGARERKINREVLRIHRLLRKKRLLRRFRRRRRSMMRRMTFLRDVIKGLRHTLNKARRSPCIVKNYKHLKHLRKITCSVKKLKWLSKHGKSWATKELRRRRKLQRILRGHLGRNRRKTRRRRR